MPGILEAGQKSGRYSRLKPLEPSVALILAIDVCNFFNPMKCGENREFLGLPPMATITPFSMAQFCEWAEKERKALYEVHRYRQHIVAMLARMVQVGVLTFEGHSGRGTMGFGSCYFFTQELSQKASRGVMWLGKVLGPGFIGFQAAHALVRITGITKVGDHAVGTGVHVLPNFVVTCAHVVSDMTVDQMLLVRGFSTTVVNQFVSNSADVGVIEVNPAISCYLPDLAYRNAGLLEEIVVAGFPAIPTAVSGCATFQTGEICQTDVDTIWKTRIDLFSAIARPGNSGGPIFSLDGNILGMVTQSLERDKESVDPMRPLPFFASVPASVIQKEFCELTGQELPWEDYS